jgi:hypothetical protein
MSRPYIHITNATYSTGVLTVNLQAYHTRGGGAATITGFSSSLSFNIAGNTLNGVETFTFSRAALGGGQGGATPSGNYNLVVSFPELGYNTGTYPDTGDTFTF